MAGVFIKYKWIIFAVVLCWSFALAGRVYIEEASAAEVLDFDYETPWASGSGVNATTSTLYQQEFKLTNYYINKLQVYFCATDITDLSNDLRLKIYTNSPASSSQELLYNATSTSRTLVVANCYYLNFTDLDIFKTQSINARFFAQFNLIGNWENPSFIKGDWLDPGEDYLGVNYFVNYVLVSTNSLYIKGYYDDGYSPTDPNEQYTNIEIYDDPYFERHHLSVPSPQWCINDASEPCRINFKFNNRSYYSGIKVYNDVNGSPVGSEVASGTLLQLRPALTGSIQVPLTATTSEGYNLYCFKLYDSGLYSNYAVEWTCGVQVYILSPSSITCTQATTNYRLEHDAGTICNDIATSSIWELDTWPGELQCGGRKLSYWLFTASTTDYYDFCKSVFDVQTRFPMNILNTLGNKITAWASADKPATTTILLPLYWGSTSTGADLLPIEEATTRVGFLYGKYYSTLEFLIWLLAAWIIIKDLLLKQETE